MGYNDIFRKCKYIYRLSFGVNLSEDGEDKIGDSSVNIINTKFVVVVIHTYTLRGIIFCIGATLFLFTKFLINH